MTRSTTNKALFTKRSNSTVLIVLMLPVAISLGAGIYFAVEGGPVMTAVITTVSILVMTALAALASLTVTLTRANLQVRSTLLRVKVLDIQVPDMLDVNIERTSALSWGGWGYRVKGRDTAVMLDGGETAVIRRKNGRRVFIACDGAAELVEALKDLLDPSTPRS